jgi:hypothetical protein
MILEQDGVIYHDEHDIQVKISNDNTKHLKVVTVTLRKDLKGMDPIEIVKEADKLYKEALGS